MAIPMNGLRFGSVAVSSIVLLSAGGCGSLGVALSTRTRLDKLPVVALSATLSPRAGLSPGKSGRLIIVATTADGQKLVTVGAGQGKVLFDSFTFDSTLVQVSRSGVVSLPADPRVSNGQTAHVHVTVVGHPDITADLDIPSRYDAAFAAHFSGSSGMNGFDGIDGLPGSDGANGSMDPANPSAGSNGSDGGRGSDGANGGDGAPGQSVHIWATLRPGTPTLIQVHVASPGQEQFFLIDPDGGSLSIDANGGAAGRGGSGGKGGRGGVGGFGMPSGFPGQNGLNGSDGHPGFDGAAGRIFVSIDPASRKYLERFHFSNKDGGGFPGPAPEVRTEPVAPIW